MSAARSTTNPTARFMAKVAMSPACWMWQASGVPKGYGVFRFHGRQQYAHRVSYQLFVGGIPDGKVVMHSCDNPRCVNPAHLALGTAADNNADMMAKGRHRTNPVRGDRHWMRRQPCALSGERNGRARLTANDATEIRRLYADGNTQKAIAAHFGIRQAQVSSIVRRESWVL